MQTTLEVIFFGRVQQVGFRRTAQLFAKKLTLCGSCENLSDGSVKIIAQGKKEAIDQLILSLKEEFEIDRTTQKEIELETLDSFEIS